MTTPLRAVVAATLIASASGAGLAQTQTAPPAAAAASAVKPTSGSGYQSAFDGYRRFDEQKLLSWRESNDLVGRIGGWQAYARESAGGEAMPPSHGDMAAPAASGTAASTSPAALKAAAATQAASMPSDTTHGGHAMPKAP